MVKNLSLIKYLIKEHFSVIGFILTYFILLACKIIYFKTPFYSVPIVSFSFKSGTLGVIGYGLEWV